MVSDTDAEEKAPISDVNMEEPTIDAKQFAQSFIGDDDAMSDLRKNNNKNHNKYDPEVIRETMKTKIAAKLSKSQAFRKANFDNNRQKAFVNDVAEEVASNIIGKRERSQSMNKPSPNVRPKKQSKEPEPISVSNRFQGLDDDDDDDDEETKAEIREEERLRKLNSGIKNITARLSMATIISIMLVHYTMTLEVNLKMLSIYERVKAISLIMHPNLLTIERYPSTLLDNTKMS